MITHRPTRAHHYENLLRCHSLDLKLRRRFLHPLQRIRATNATPEHQMTEKIEPYIVAPWESRLEYIKADINSTEANVCTSLKPGEVRIVFTSVE